MINSCDTLVFHLLCLETVFHTFCVSLSSTIHLFVVLFPCIEHIKIIAAAHFDSFIIILTDRTHLIMMSFFSAIHFALSLSLSLSLPSIYNNIKLG